ncbi:RNase H domain-containing protein [Nephila pilipes]|uniref:RNase H domain-containing protein n=1 Tax=Nephila pilipes TaxID=299642 RepID=A0A8X6Q5J3_NEPPI|nr:RNase H domain-containing protein [Nephila pilipes]
MVIFISRNVVIIIRQMDKKELQEIINVIKRNVDDVDDVWILTDRKCSIQYLRNWPNIQDKLGQDIILKLSTLTQRGTVCLQKIPSHVGVYGNKVADLLPGESSELPTAPSTELLMSTP